MVDLVCDWFFFFQFYQIDDEYVIQNIYLKWFVLVFGVVGIFFFIFEIINLGFEVFFDRGFCFYVDIVFTVIIWVEDVFQICLVLIVAIYQRSLIYWIQFVKVAWVLMELIIRGVGQCLYCCVIFERYSKKFNYCVVVFKFIV